MKFVMAVLVAMAVVSADATSSRRRRDAAAQSYVGCGAGLQSLDRGPLLRNLNRPIEAAWGASGAHVVGLNCAKPVCNDSD